MKRSIQKKPLDEKDKKIYYRHFGKKKLGAYALALWAWVYVLIEVSQTGTIKAMIFMFPLFNLAAIIIFYYGFREFKHILKTNEKIVRTGKIKMKWKKTLGKGTEYCFLLEGNPYEVPVTKVIYRKFSKSDYVELHTITGNNVYTCRRAERITP